MATIGLGLATGLAAAALLSATLDEPALRAWGWRLAFLLALPLGLVGLYIRLRIEETPGFLAVQRLGAATRTPLGDTLRTARRSVVVGFGLVAAVAPPAGRLSDRVGGTAPALAAFLVRRTGDALWPAWYATGLTLVALVCALLAPETLGRPLDAGADRASGPGGER